MTSQGHGNTTALLKQANKQNSGGDFISAYILESSAHL